MHSLTLTFQESESPYRYSRIDWPPGGPRLQAYLGSKKNVAQVNVSFIMANTPPDYRIYFVIATLRTPEHDNMKASLESFGEQFEETIERREIKQPGFIRQRSVEREGRIIFSSTYRREVISSVFDNYVSWEEGTPFFFFFVARQEPPDWKNVWRILSANRPLPPDLVSTTHCLMRSVVDDGMFIASTEITREQMLTVANKVATEMSMDLTIRTNPSGDGKKIRHL